MPYHAILLYIKRLLTRHERNLSFIAAVRIGFKGFVIISVLSAVSHFSDTPTVIAPFGASCLLITTMPKSVLAQPINVIGGYIIATLVTIFFTTYFPHQWWTIGMMLATTVSAMAYFRVTHAPAGAVPLVAYYYEGAIGFDFLFTPILTGSILMVVLAMLLHSLPPKKEYPRKIVS